MWFGVCIAGAMRIRALVPLLLGLATVGPACSSQDSDDEEMSEGALSGDTVCTQAAAYPNGPLAKILRAEGGELGPGDAPIIGNWTAWPTYDASGDSAAYDPNIVKARESATDARENLASRFGSGCKTKVKKHLQTKKPNVYVYFTGFGGASANNSLVDEGALLHWINKRDPKGLIFSINWSCADSHDTWCKDNAVKLKVLPTSPEYKKMEQTVNAIAPQAMATVQQILAMTDANQEGYNTALSHAMQLGALLVDQLLVADDGGKIGDINFLGYSMGAHAASQILVQDFLGDGKGFQWTRAGQCDDGGNTCTVAHLKKVKWSLALGLSGWSEALLSYNGFNAAGVPSRPAEDTAQFRNGGLYRIKDDRFNGKGNVFNRRMDPTSNSDDTFQRGFGDIFFSDYNHYSHDYSMPLFVMPGFVRALDAFLEAPQVTDSKDLGIAFDNAGLVDFDDCPADGDCNAQTG